MFIKCEWCLNADATNDVACNEAINATDSYTPSAEYALKMLEYIAKDTEALKSAAYTELVRESVECRFTLGIF